MNDRRTFMKLAAALIPAGLSAQTSPQTPAPAGPPELARHALTGELDGLDVLLLELRPRAVTGQHRHTGPVLGYVLEGAVRFGVDNGPERIVPAGQTFFEATGALHSTWGSVDANTPARVLVFMVVPKGTSGTVAP